MQEKQWNEAYMKVKSSLATHPWVPHSSLFKWAYFCNHTRCISKNDPKSPGGILIAPFLDCLNHSHHANMNAGLTDDGYIITSQNQFKSGSQVFINYGPHDDNFLLAEYGFISEHNPFNFVSLDEDLENELGSVRGLLEAHGMYGDFSIAKDDLGYRAINALALLECETENEVVIWKSIQKGGYIQLQPGIRIKALKRLDRICKVKMKEYINNKGLLNDIKESFERFCALGIMSGGIDILENVIEMLNAELEAEK